MSNRSQNNLFLLIAFLINIFIFKWFGAISFLVLIGFVYLLRKEVVATSKNREVLKITIAVGIFFLGLSLIGFLGETTGISNYISGEVLGAMIVAIIVGIAVLRETKRSNNG